MEPDQLRHFEQILRERADRLRRELQELQARTNDEAYSRVASEAPDRGDASLADMITGLNNSAIGRSLTELRNTDAALGRIESGTYGICQRCGQQIDPARLEAFPTALYDLEHQDEAEATPTTGPPPSL
jgi:DnaK suppressor protein